MFSVFNPSKCTHTWSSGQPRLRRPGSSWGFGALLKGLTSVVDNSCRSRDLNPQPRVTSPTLYPLGHDSPIKIKKKNTTSATHQCQFQNSGSIRRPWRRGKLCKPLFTVCSKLTFQLLSFLLLHHMSKWNAALFLKHSWALSLHICRRKNVFCVNGPLHWDL